MPMRFLTEFEKSVLQKLLSDAGLRHDCDQVQVVELPDGGMGSLGIGSNYQSRSFGRQVASYEFADDDGIVVSCALNVDKNGDLYELDFWKVDFSPRRAL